MWNQGAAPRVSSSTRRRPAVAYRLDVPHCTMHVPDLTERAMWWSRGRQPIHLCRCAAVQRHLFRCRCAGCYAFESVPQLGVATGLLIGRKVALEHAPVDTERIDAALDIRPPRRCQILGGRRCLTFMKVKTNGHHAESAELAVNVRTLG